MAWRRRLRKRHRKKTRWVATGPGTARPAEPRMALTLGQPERSQQRCQKQLEHLVSRELGGGVQEEAARRPPAMLRSSPGLGGHPKGHQGFVHRKTIPEDKKAAICKPTREAAEETKLAQSLSRTSSLQNWEKTHFCCLSHSVCGIFLWHP